MNFDQTCGQNEHFPLVLPAMGSRNTAKTGSFDSFQRYPASNVYHSIYDRDLDERSGQF